MKDDEQAHRHGQANEHGSAHHHGQPAEGGPHEHGDEDAQALMSAAFWDERYGSTGQIWSGRPNQRLVEQVGELAPGRALDIGSGEGGDAIWLARQGWRVTAADVSAVGLARAHEHAVAAGVADQISFQQADVLSWAPPEQAYDLVTSHFLHMPRELMAGVHGRWAGAVAPGGSLLVVGHDLADGMHRPHLAQMFFTPDDVASVLTPGEWRIAFSGSPAREATMPDGTIATIRDAVLHAVRLREH